jgi:hypothetical protein
MPIPTLRTELSGDVDVASPGSLLLSCTAFA